MRDCILVTGGAGFIGSALSRSLCTSDLSVVAIDSLLVQVHPTGQRSEFLDDRVVLLKSDIREPATWTSFLSDYRPVHIIHLAAETGTAQSLTEATRHASVNVVGTTEMLDALARAGIRPERIILSSSRAVYGEGKWRDTLSGREFYPGPRTHSMLAAGRWVPAGPDGGEATPCPHRADDVFADPTSIYGSTKLAQENVLSAWCGSFDVPLSILRLQNVYGEGQSPHNSYTGIINVFHRYARAGNAIPVYEDGLIGRDFVHVDDFAIVFMAVLESTSRKNHRFDVGTGCETTILEAARVIARLHGAPEPKICGKFRDGDVRSAVASVTEMAKQTGVEASIDFKVGSKRVGEWLSARGYI